jgi:hypothetical protein
MIRYEKILVERAVMNEPDLPSTILRLQQVYGPGDRQRRLFDYLKRIDDGRRATMLGEGGSTGGAGRAVMSKCDAGIVTRQPRRGNAEGDNSVMFSLSEAFLVLRVYSHSLPC